MFSSRFIFKCQTWKSPLKKDLRKPIDDKIFFAGEATSYNFGTVHGADLSGKETAQDIIKVSKL